MLQEINQYEKKFNLSYENLTYTQRKIAGEIQPFLNVIKKTGAVIAGGFVRFLISNRQTAEDIDIWVFNNQQFEATDKALREMGLEVTHQTNWANTYRFGGDYWDVRDNLPLLVQLIKPIPKVNTVQQLMDAFDFTVTKCYLLGNGDVFVHPDFDKDMDSLTLNVENCQFPLITLKRMFKYSNRTNWIIPTTELLKVLNAWSSLTAEQKQESINRAGSQIYNMASFQ